MFLRPRPPQLPRPNTIWRRHKSNLPPLPPLAQWKKEFPISDSIGRIHLRKSTTADYLANKFIPKRRDGEGEGKIVIEAYPGPGVLTRSLLSLPPDRLKKLIVLEEEPCFFKHLQLLEKHDPRITVVPSAGFSWSSYSDIESKGLLEDVKEMPWEGGASNLQFISHIPNTVVGDQIVAQFIRSIPERTWLFKYGRVQMSFILRHNLWERVCATPRSKPRCKVSVIAEAVADFEEAISPKAISPYADHFYPPPSSGGRGVGRMGSRALGQPFAAVNVWPRADSYIEKGLLEKWDYVTRHLFVLKCTPLKKAIGSLAFGATNLLTPLKDPSLPAHERVDVDKLIRDLSIQDWALIVKAFDEWPFAPDTLSIRDHQYTDIERD